MIGSCKHNGFVVVYVLTNHPGSDSLECPVCKMERKIKDLEDEVENLRYEILYAGEREDV